MPLVHRSLGLRGGDGLPGLNLAEALGIWAMPD
jgi:hypothetical protein